MLVGATVTKHRLYAKTGQLVGELLASGAEILVSLLTVQESLWAITRISYYELAKQPSHAHFSQSIYEKWRDRVFQSFGPRMEAVSKMLNGWVAAGVNLKVVPRTVDEFLAVSSRTPAYMYKYSLTPADAAHLALAEIYAKSFATADSDYRDVANRAASQPLDIVHLAP